MTNREQTMDDQPVRVEDLREGDRMRVTFDATFDKAADFGCHLTTANGERRFIYNSELATIHRLPKPPKPLKVGDRVRFNGVPGTIIGVDGGVGWVRWDDGARSARGLSDLTLIEGDAQ